MFTKQETDNLNVVFQLARQSAVGDELTLLNLINFKKELIDKYGFKEPQKAVGEEVVNEEEAVNEETTNN